MSLEILLEAALFLEYQTEAQKRGEYTLSQQCIYILLQR
jgi:hypothetical protein